MRQPPVQGGLVAKHTPPAGPQDRLHIGVKLRDRHHRHPIQTVANALQRVTGRHQTQLGAVVVLDPRPCDRATTSLTLRRGGTASRRDKCGEGARPDWPPQALVESVILVGEGVTLLG